MPLRRRRPPTLLLQAKLGDGERFRHSRQPVPGAGLGKVELYLCDRRMSASLGKCPVCGHQVPGNSERFQRHVNKHLDDSEEAESKRIAEELHRGSQVAAASSNTGLSDVGEALGPAERLIRQQEQDDAALAAALAGGSGAQSTNPNFVNPSLRGSLSDSAEFFYPNIISKIFPQYDTLDGILKKKVHISPKLDLFCSNVAGLGWDCGFRNIQMFFSALLYDPESRLVLRAAGISEVPSVPEIAGRIEEAWKKGFDPEGAATFGGSLTDKEVWIGATEVFILLRSIDCSAFVKDFETPTAAQKRRMFEWLFAHFENWCNGRHCLLHSKGILGPRKPCLVPPVFFQWQGHSITIVGAEKTKTGEVILIVMDPSRGFYHSLMERKMSRLRLVRRSLDHPQFDQPRFQVVSLPSGKVASSTSVGDVRRKALGKLRRHIPR